MTRCGNTRYSRMSCFPGCGHGDESAYVEASPLPRHRILVRWCDACGRESVGSLCDRCDDFWEDRW